MPLSYLFGGKPLKIANKYLKRDKARLSYGITNPKANKLIKEIAKLAKINKYLTFHSSRHTFATHMVQKVGLLYAQSLLQHGDIKTTSGYLHVDQVEIFEELKNMENGQKDKDGEQGKKGIKFTITLKGTTSTK